MAREGTIVTQNRVVMREFLNDQGNLFGGYALKWMDEVAYITATKFTRQRMVTVSADKIRFLLPVTEGAMLLITGRVISAGIVRSVINVELWMDDELTPGGIKAIDGFFTLVAVDEAGRPVRRMTSETQQQALLSETK